MNRRLPPLDALQSFEVASRVLSFTRAAEELHVTPAAVSHRIKILEERLGISLFHRKNNKLLLTEQGLDLVPEVRRALESVADVTARVAQTEGSNVLSLSLLPTFAVRWLMPRLADFQSAHGDVAMRLSTTYRAVDFTREHYDAAIRFGGGDWPGLECCRLFDEELIPVCSPALLEGREELQEPEDLERFTLLHSDTCDENWSIWLDAAGASNVDPERGLRFDSCLLTLQAAQDGLGIAAANREYVARDLDAGRLVAPFDLTVRKEVGWHLVCPESAADQPKIAAFRTWALDQAATGRFMADA